MSSNDFIVNRLASIMQERKLSGWRIAKLCNYPRTSVANYLSGKRQVPIIFVFSFCSALKISMSDFFEGWEGVRV